MNIRSVLQLCALFSGLGASLASAEVERIVVLPFAVTDDIDQQKGKRGSGPFLCVHFMTRV